MIVVISHSKDPHASYVLDLLRADGEETLLVDLSDLPDRASLTIDYDHGGPQQLRYRLGETDTDLAEARSVWWLRPQAPLPAHEGDVGVLVERRPWRFEPHLVLLRRRAHKRP